MDRKYIKKRLFFWYSILWIFLFAALYVAYGVYFVDMKSTISKWIVLCVGSIAVLFGVCKNLEISFYQGKNNFLKNVISYFFNGVNVFYSKQNKIIYAILFLLAYPFIKFLGIQFFISFVCGVLIAQGSIFVVNYISTSANARIFHAIQEKIGFGLKLILDSGIAMAMLNIGISLIVTVILFHNFKDYQVINGIALGISFVALFANIAGLSVKNALYNCENVIFNFFDDIKQDDRRNPLLLLGGISRTTFPLVGLSIEMLEAYIAVVISSMAIGNECYALMGMFLPLIIAANGLFSTIFVLLLTGIKKHTDSVRTLFVSSLISIVLFDLITYKTTTYWILNSECLVFSVILGTIFGYLACYFNANNVFLKYRAVRNVTNSAITGTTSALVQTIKESFLSTVLPCLFIALLFSVSFLISDGVESPEFGIFGISLAVLGMLSTVGIIIVINTFGFVSNSVNVVSKSYETDFDIPYQQDTSLIGKIGFQTISLCRNFVNCSSILASLAVLISFVIITGVEQVDILNPYLITSFLCGTFVPFLYCGLILGGSSKIASELIMQVKKQFRNYPQILRFQMRPDYEKCVDVASLNSSIQILIYSLIMVILLFLIGFNFGIEAIACFVFAVIISSSGLIFIASNSSIISTSAKKYFEKEFINAKYAPQYSSISETNSFYSITGDIIVPSLNSLIKFLSILALTLLPLFLKFTQGV